MHSKQTLTKRFQQKKHQNYQHSLRLEGITQKSTLTNQNAITKLKAIKLANA